MPVSQQPSPNSATQITSTTKICDNTVTPLQQLERLYLSSEGSDLHIKPLLNEMLNDGFLPSPQETPDDIVRLYMDLWQKVIYTDSNIIARLPPFYLYFSGNQYLELLRIFDFNVVPPPLGSRAPDTTTVEFPAYCGLTEASHKMVLLDRTGALGPFIQDMVKGEPLDWGVIGEDVVIDNVTEEHTIVVYWPSHPVQVYTLENKVFSRHTFAQGVARAVQQLVSEFSPDKLQEGAGDIINMFPCAVKNIDYKNLRLLPITKYAGNYWVPTLALDVKMNTVGISHEIEDLKPKA